MSMASQFDIATYLIQRCYSTLRRYHIKKLNFIIFIIFLSALHFMIVLNLHSVLTFLIKYKLLGKEPHKMNKIEISFVVHSSSQII